MKKDHDVGASPENFIILGKDIEFDLKVSNSIFIRLAGKAASLYPNPMQMIPTF